MAKTDKPNILIIWGDDIGWFNVSMNNNGIMGYRTPNIDRIAKEGCNFTDWYGQQSCTAGRAAFITGQSPIRTGLTKVGLPGADLGLQPEDPTIADVLKPLGYVSGQFGKNHLGDRDEFLPTAHGFDEFFGNLYHLNAEQEPENPDYPKDPEFKKKYGPRGVLHTWANPDGTQKIENTGPLTIKRMETVDEEFLDASLKFMDKAVKDGKPFFCWWNSTRMHIFTHLKKESEGKTGLGIYPDGMVEHDGHVGKLLDKLDQLGIADNTNLQGPHRRLHSPGRTRRRQRRQRDEHRAHEQAETAVQPLQSRNPAAADRARRRSGSSVRPDRLHRGAASSR
jgi:arylsulfatase A-like enzyme